MAEEKRYRVRILDRRDVTLYDKDGVPVPTKEVMYSTMDLSPGILRIPLDKYSAEEEDRAVRADIESRLKVKPEVREV